MTTFYSLLSHDCRIVPLQVAAIRKFLPDVERIVFVQGPFGSNAMTSAGPKRLCPTVAAKLGASILNVPDTFAGLLMGERVRSIVQWVGERILAQSEPFAYLTHGDLLPARRMDAESLLNGNSLAARVHDGMTPGSAWIPGTWRAINARTASPADFELLREDRAGITCCDTRRMSPEETVGGVTVGDLKWEWCEPGWLHLDKLATAMWEGPVADRFSRSVVLARQVMRSFGVEASADDPCEPVPDPQSHRGRLLTEKPWLFDSAGNDGCNCA